MSKVNAHTQYTMNTGDNVPGVTTVLDILAKPALIKWANNLGLKGIDSTKFKDKMADIGKIAHKMILAYLSKEPLITFPDYSKADIESAENCMKSYYEWEKVHTLEPIILETPLTSDIYGYGGTPDFIGMVDGQLELLDFKTGNGIWPEHFYQLAAYRQLAIEQGHKVNRARILRIGRDDNEGFEERLITRFDDEFELFKHCLAIYNLQKAMKRG